MERHIDADEPRPLDLAGEWTRTPMAFAATCALPARIAAPDADFFTTLHGRRSAIGAAAEIDRIAALLWHATQLRERRLDGRFGLWESRTCPSAGGLHPISLLVIPLAVEGMPGIYLDGRHAIGVLEGDPADAISSNRTSVAALANSASGTTIQLVADTAILSACYENWTSLLWRDAGAMIATLSLIATALELTAVPLGREGTDIVRAFGLDAPFTGVGAVHIGAGDAASV
jgi:hypothetical protein